jgi:hypothetical protein
MFTYYLHITSCRNEDFLDKLSEIIPEEKKNFITIVTTPPNPHIFGFFCFFTTHYTYPEVTSFFRENFQKDNSWVLIEVSSSKVGINQPKEYTELLLESIPQSSLLEEEVDLTKLSTERLNKLIEVYTEQEEFFKCGEILEIIKSRENV